MKQAIMYLSGCFKNLNSSTTLFCSIPSLTDWLASFFSLCYVEKGRGEKRRDLLVGTVKKNHTYLGLDIYLETRIIIYVLYIYV